MTCVQYLNDYCTLFILILKGTNFQRVRNRKVVENLKIRTIDFLREVPEVRKIRHIASLVDT